MGVVKAPVCNLVNSKMPWKAILHLTLKGQRDCGCCVKQYTPMLWKFHSSDLTNRVTEGFETLRKGVPERGIIGTRDRVSQCANIVGFRSKTTGRPPSATPPAQVRTRLTHVHSHSARVFAYTLLSTVLVGVYVRARTTDTAALPPLLASNRAALRAAQALAPAEATIDIFDLQEIPLWGPWARRVPSITCGKSLSF